MFKILFRKMSPLFNTIPVFVLLGNCNGCRPAAREYYAPNDVTVRHIGQTQEGNMLIEYDVKSETLFSSPGVDIRRTGNNTYVYVVRSHINRNCKVDVRATTAPRAPHSVVLDIPINHDVYISDDHGKILVWRDGSDVTSDRLGNIPNSDDGF